MSDTLKPVELEANGEVYSLLSYDGYDFPFTSSFHFSWYHFFLPFKTVPLSVAV